MILQFHKSTSMRFGLGDLIMILPTLSAASKERKVLLKASTGHDVPGMRALVHVVAPDLNIVWRRFYDTMEWYHHPIDESVPQYINWAHHYGLDPRFTLCEEYIKRIPQIEGLGDFILIHPRSSTDDRWWDHWRNLDLRGIKYFILERPGNQSFLEGKRLHVDFYTAARYMVSCKALVCVDSCMMHLANILGVSSVTIRCLDHVFMPNLGESLYHPCAEEVRESLDRMINFPQIS